MADENEDQWLYGDSVDGKDVSATTPGDETQKDESFFEAQEDSSLMASRNSNDDTHEATGTDEPEAPVEDEESGASQPEAPDPPESNENETSNGNGNDQSNLLNSEDMEAISESDSDDDVHVVIGDIKSTPAYSSLNIKRGGLLTSTGGVPDKLGKQPGKFSIDEFETIGSINGIPAHEFNLDQLEDKPWRQPGADITDYFNYGFNEDTWRAYCERQKRMRSESGVGLILNAGGPGNNASGPGARMPQVTITNYNSKYSGIMGPKRAGPPPGRKMAGTIDVIGSTGLASRRNLDKSPPKENVIQVMTADRREYSRKQPGGFPDMSVPPPGAGMPPPFDMPPPGYPNEPVPYFVHPEVVDPYYQSYEPTQDRQWGTDPVKSWQPANLNIPLTDGENNESSSKSIPTMVPPTQVHHPMMSRESRESRDRDRERDREREIESMSRDRDRERERDKESIVRERESVTRDDEKERERGRSQYRHKERHRHRSRSRSRRHKSRSRSPSRRKKKSRRSERERSKEESE